MSEDARDDSRNLRASPYATKQKQWGDLRLWWFIVVAKGKVHIQVMPTGWQQHGQGLALVVGLLPGILRKMLGRGQKQPDFVFTDRGPGMFFSGTGGVVP